MRVLLCSPVYPVGGISKWTEYILEYYKYSHEKDIHLTHYYGNSEDLANASGGASIFSRLTSGLKLYLPMYKHLKKVFKTKNYDVIHLCTSASISLVKDILILQEARKNNIKSVVHFHFGRIPEIFENKNWEYKLISKVLNLADKVIVIDLKSYDTLKSAGYDNIVYLPNPLTPAVTEIIKENPFIKRDRRTLFFAGHHVVTKGVFELIEACRQIPNIKLKMFGFVTDEMRENLQKSAGEKSEEWLEIKGEQSFENTVKQMLASGLFVLPTYTEGFPNVIIESMACGCSIVTTDVGAIPEMLDIKNGFKYGICVKPKDVNGLKAAINKMLDDTEYACNCGKNAERRVNEQYSLEIIGNKLSDIWRSVI